jgi:hypothetical protein
MEWVAGSPVGVAVVGACGGATEAVVAKTGVCAIETSGILFFSGVMMRDGAELIFGKEPGENAYTRCTIEVLKSLTLKWVLSYYFRMTEKQEAAAMYALTAVFCIIGLYVPG